MIIPDIMEKIYTGRGDSGTTGLLARERVSKTDIRIEVNGQIDELMAVLGQVRAYMGETDENRLRIEQVQRELMTVMRHVASSGAADCSDLESRVMEMEQFVDAACEETDFRFVLPGANPVEATLHVARARVRTVERRMWQAGDGCTLSESVMRYINRLSDYLFVLACGYR